MSLIVRELREVRSWQDVVALPRSSASECWNGDCLARPFQWSLTIDSQRLWFVSEIPAAPSEKKLHGSGEFVEGLWESNVAELFVMASDGKYQEFNVSEDGAWWAMTFLSHRVRSPSPKVPKGVTITTERSTQSWTAIMAIPLASLEVEWNQNVALHVCGILYRQGVPTYLTSKAQSGFPPDFHDSRCFQSVSWPPRQ